MIRIKTKCFTELGKYLLNGYFLTVLPEPNQKSMVEHFCKNSYRLVVVKFFLQKAPSQMCSKNALLPLKEKETKYLK